MAVDQLPGQIREFANYLNSLLARLDQGGGWCGVFWQRDPDGMQACLDGREVPPWDVVEALLHDLAVGYGAGAVAQEAEHARALHAAALEAYDSRPGGRGALGDRLDVMLREQKYAAERQAELGRLLASATTREQADALRLDLAWAHDDHERATARCAELRSRIAELDRRSAGGQVREAHAMRRAGGSSGAGGGVAGGDPTWVRGSRAVGPHSVMPRQRDAGAASGRPDEQGTQPGAVDWLAARRTAAGWREAERATPEPTGPHATHGPAPDPGDPHSASPRGSRGPSAGAEGQGGPRGSHGSASDPRDPHGRSAGAQGPGGSRGSYGSGSDLRDPHGESAGAQGPGGSRGSYGSAADLRDPHHPSRGAQGPGGSHGSASDPRDPRVPSTDSQGSHGPHDASADPHATPTPAGNVHDVRPSATPTSTERPIAPDATTPAPPPPATSKQRKRRRGSARFAGMADERDAPTVVPPSAPTLAAPSAPATGRTPRGARFAGAPEDAQLPEPEVVPLDAEAGQVVGETVAVLLRLRTEGRTGEAHALLVEAAYWPAARFPLLAAELHRAGLGADWTTLLWEAASLPADRLVAAADALVAAGRDADGQQILRQGVVRPAEEIGDAVLALVGEGRNREVRALLDAYVRVRTPEDAARSAAADPQRLVPLLVEAARGVSDERHWDLVHALRVAGHTT